MIPHQRLPSTVTLCTGLVSKLSTNIKNKLWLQYSYYSLWKGEGGGPSGIVLQDPKREGGRILGAFPGQVSWCHHSSHTETSGHKISPVAEGDGIATAFHVTERSTPRMKPVEEFVIMS